MGAGIRRRGPVERPGRGGHRHDHADPPVPGLCHAGRPAAGGGDLCQHRAAGRLCGFRDQPRAGRRAGRRGLADDGRRDRPDCGAGLARLLGGGDHFGLPFGAVSGGHGDLPAGFSRQLPEPSGDFRFHHRVRPDHRSQPAQAHPGDRGRGPQSGRAAVVHRREPAADQPLLACDRRCRAGLPVLGAPRVQACPDRPGRAAAPGRCDGKGGSGRSRGGFDPGGHPVRPGRPRRRHRRHRAPGSAAAHPALFRSRDVDDPGRIGGTDQHHRLRGVRLRRPDPGRQETPTHRPGPGTDRAGLVQPGIGVFRRLSGDRRLRPVGGQLRCRG